MAKKPKGDSMPADLTTDPQTEGSLASANAPASAGRGDREGRSKREWIQQDGSHGQPDTAIAVRYTYLRTGESVDYGIGHLDHADRMLAGFGALTLFGNVVNTEIHGGGNPDDGVKAIKERLELLRSGTWIERGGDGAVGTRVNRDALAQAVAEVMAELGKSTFKDGYATDQASVRQRLEEDTKGVFVRQYRQVPAILQRYSELAGVQVKTKDASDL